METWYADFIRSKFDADENGYVFASLNNDLGILIKSQLRLQPPTADTRDYSGSHVEFILPDYDNVNTLYRNYISQNGEKIILKWIRKKFYLDLHNHIMELHHSGMDEIKAAIINFCEAHDIYEDRYNYDTFKKEYYRYRKRIDNAKNAEKLRKISSVFSMVLSFLCPVAVLTLPL